MKFQTFQFHKGTIRTNEARWNEAKHLNFNSIKVRLEQMGDNTTAALVSAFQFHKGTIRTTVFQFRHRPMSISIP